MKIAEYLQQVLTENKLNFRKKTYQSYQSKLNNFTDWLEHHQLDTLKIQDFDYTLAQKFLNELDRHIITRHSHKQFLGYCFAILKKKGIIERNPFEDTTLPKKRTTEALRHFTPKERTLLKTHLEAYYPELWLFVQCMFYTLIRPNELRLLKVGDIKLDDNLILVRAENAKNHQSQFVTIPANFKEVLSQAIDKLPPHYFVFGHHKPRGINYFNNLHNKVLQTLNIKTDDVALYSWKHTGAVCFADATRDVHSLMRQMRHSSLEITERYLASRNVKQNPVVKNEYPTL